MEKRINELYVGVVALFIIMVALMAGCSRLGELVIDITHPIKAMQDAREIAKFKRECNWQEAQGAKIKFMGKVSEAEAARAKAAKDAEESETRRSPEEDAGAKKGGDAESTTNGAGAS